MSDLAEAVNRGGTYLYVSPGVYRLTDGPLVISGAKDFTFNASDVEIVCESDISTFRLLNNTNLVIKGTMPCVNT